MVTIVMVSMDVDGSCHEKSTIVQRKWPPGQMDNVIKKYPIFLWMIRGYTYFRNSQNMALNEFWFMVDIMNQYSWGLKNQHLHHWGHHPALSNLTVSFEGNMWEHRNLKHWFFTCVHSHLTVFYSHFKRFQFRRNTALNNHHFTTLSL